MAWITESNRWKHLLGGFALGLVSCCWWCALLVGCAAGGSLEFKDRAHGGKWDWADFALTAGGALIGQGVVAVIRLAMRN